MSDESDLEKKIKDFKLNEKPDINILLLGETGVGKSTFINSVANYLTYTDLGRAENENLLSLIPANWEVVDKYGKYHTIQIGSKKDKNEYQDPGVSATQDVKTYVFPIWGGKTKVRLIDTPGMGDTRGIEQDDINCENILAYIGQLHELHAICFLFKPTNPRITIFFKYCMSQILSRLDKSASKNIIFIFTNTRGTDYSPGDTLRSLREVVKDIKARPPYVEIPLNENKNIFCFDNEAFKYLAAVKQNVEFDNSIKLRNKESWQKSATQCWELIKYIVGDTTNPALKPHFIKSTSAINEARRIITQLSKPLAEISQLINDNLFALHRHQEHLNVDKNSLEQLKQKLYMPVINLEVTTLTQPVTVCSSTKCAVIYKVGDTSKWDYKQRCHDPCYLTNVQKEIIGDPGLIHCAAMNPSKKCKECGCDFSVHMHVYYMTKTKEDRVVDPNVQKNINNKERILQNASQLVNNILDKKKELEKEHNVIVKCCARFAHFLQNNAITPFNDSYKDYIKHLIIREKAFGVMCNMSVVHHLETLMSEYEEAKKSFNEALTLQRKLGETDFITPQKIQDSIQELYKLKHNGKKIKELYECQKKSRSKEHEYTEYVHKMVYKQPKSEKKDESKKDKKGNNFQKKTDYKNKQNDTKKDKKENEFQKKADYKNRHYNKDVRTENQQRSYRSKSQQREIPSTPPPSYEDLSRRGPPSRPKYPHPVNSPYHPPPHSYAAYSSPAYGPGQYPPPHGPAPYPPAHGTAQGPSPYFYPPRPKDTSSNQTKDGGTTYAIKVVLDNIKPREYTPGEYPHPPKDYYPSYPPTPLGPYGTDYYGPHAYPAPPLEKPQNYSRVYYHQGTSGQSSGATHSRGGTQRYKDNGNDRGKRGYRGGRGQSAINKNQKFKLNHYKKRNGESNEESDDDSDTSSVASSKKILFGYNQQINTDLCDRHLPVVLFFHLIFIFLVIVWKFY